MKIDNISHINFNKFNYKIQNKKEDFIINNVTPFDSVTFSAKRRRANIANKPALIDNSSEIELAEKYKAENEAFRNKLQNYINVIPEFTVENIDYVYGTEKNQIKQIFLSDSKQLIGYTIYSKDDNSETTCKFKEDGQLEFIASKISQMGHLVLVDKFYSFDSASSTPITILENLIYIDGKCHFEKGIAPTFNFNATEHNQNIAARNFEKFLQF